MYQEKLTSHSLSVLTPPGHRLKHEQYSKTVLKASKAQFSVSAHDNTRLKLHNFATIYEAKVVEGRGVDKVNPARLN